MNRIKSHPDVGEAWYPDLLRQIREQQAAERAANNRANSGSVLGSDRIPSAEQPQTHIKAH